MAHKIEDCGSIRTKCNLASHTLSLTTFRPSKTLLWLSKYNYWKADEKFQDIARMLGFASQKKAVKSSFTSCGVTVGIKNVRIKKLEKLGKIACMKLPCLLECSPGNPLVADMEEIMADLTMVCVQDQIIVYQPWEILSLFLYLLKNVIISVYLFV